MANVQINALKQATTINDTDIMIIEDVLETQKVSISQLGDKMGGTVQVDLFENFPIVGVVTKLYIATQDSADGIHKANTIYRWDGTIYKEVGSVLKLGETDITAYAGNKGKLLSDRVDLWEVPKTENATLLATGWVGALAPYTQSITLSEATNGVVTVPETITVAQNNALLNANVIDISHVGKAVIFKIDGTKPTINIPLEFTLHGSMTTNEIPVYIGNGNNAKMVTYDNAVSGLNAGLVQDAIDELVDKKLSNTNIVNNLETIEEGFALDARQGKVINDSLATKAPLSSPAFTGSPTAPTQSTGNNSTRLATTAFVQASLEKAPSTLTITKISNSYYNMDNGTNIAKYRDGCLDVTLTIGCASVNTAWSSVGSIGVTLTKTCYLSMTPIGGIVGAKVLEGQITTSGLIQVRNGVANTTYDTSAFCFTS